MLDSIPGADLCGKFQRDLSYHSREVHIIRRKILLRIAMKPRNNWPIPLQTREAQMAPNLLWFATMVKELKCLIQRIGFILGLLAGLGGFPARATPLISELMSSNGRTLADEDGDFPDWIEISNPDNHVTDLGGWFLTDDPLQPTRWAFPHLSLPAYGQILIFVSGKDRTNDVAHLHTNFRLNSSGGYLALVQPDGITRSTTFAPYPRLRADTSFGTAERVSTTSLLNTSLPLVLVPDSESDWAADWYQQTFSPDDHWLPGTAPAALGFDTTPGAGGATVNLGRTGTPAPTAKQSTTLGGFAPELAINGDLGDFTHTLGSDANATWTLDLGRRALIKSVTLNNRSSCCGSRLRDITVEVLAADQSIAFTSPLLNPNNTGFVYPNGPDHLDVTPTDTNCGEVHSCTTKSGSKSQGHRWAGKRGRSQCAFIGRGRRPRAGDPRISTVFPHRLACPHAESQCVGLYADGI